MSWQYLFLVRRAPPGSRFGLETKRIRPVLRTGLSGRAGWGNSYWLSDYTA
jgi:hypothetical protein